MPTAVEYAVTIQWHTQNGCGSGPPAMNILHTQNGAGGGPPAQNLAAVVQPDIPPAVPPGELLLTSPLATLLLIAAVLATIRRRTTADGE
jgi:hypothetical protein